MTVHNTLPTITRKGWILFLLLVLILAGLIIGRFETGRADGGVVPTITPTSTPTFTLTPTATATNTPLPTTAVIATQENLVLVSTPTEAPPYPIVNKQPPLIIATEAPARNSITPLCWPFAIGFILVIILAASAFLRFRS
jgi:hypothetical protein